MSSNSTNPILPVPEVGRNQTKEASAGLPAGRKHDDEPSNPCGRGSFDLGTSSKALLHCRRPLIIVTFNASTIKADSKARELVYCASSYGISILGVQEHRICHQSSTEFCRVEDYHLITTSAWRNEAQVAVGGIRLLLSSKAKDSFCDIR